VWLVVGTATVGAIGAALAYSALPLLIMRAVPETETETAAANSLNTLMRQLGTSMITAVAAAVGGALVTQVDGHVLPAGAAYTVSFLAASVAALGALVIAMLTPAPADVRSETLIVSGSRSNSPQRRATEGSTPRIGAARTTPPPAARRGRRTLGRRSARRSAARLR
jgi:MFS family permease